MIAPVYLKELASSSGSPVNLDIDGHILAATQHDLVIGLSVLISMPQAHALFPNLVVSSGRFFLSVPLYQIYAIYET